MTWGPTFFALEEMGVIRKDSRLSVSSLRLLLIENCRLPKWKMMVHLTP